MRSAIRFFLLAVMGATTLCGQTTLQVPSTSYPTIQSALNAAVGGDTIQVAAGTYLENLVWPAKVLHLKGAGIGLSTIDGNQNGSCLKFAYAVGPAAIVEGFTLTNGSGELAYIGATLYRQGGAIHLRYLQLGGPSAVLSPTFRNCEITGNTAVDGGGVYMRAAGATFENCLFNNNVATANGANAGVRASAILCQAQQWHSLILKNCEFTSHGGYRTIHVESYPQFTIEDCLFAQNTSNYILSQNTGNFLLSRSVFTGNSCLWGLVHMSQGSGLSYRIESCIFADNTTNAELLRLSPFPLGSTVEFVNNTVVRNTVDSATRVVWIWGPALFTDCIIRGNLDQNGALMTNPFFLANGLGGITFQNSNIRGQAGTGPGVVDVNPLFVDPLSGDYRLQPGSPAIDSGTLSPTFTQPLLDVRGLPRVRGVAADMGAIESQSLAHHPASAGTVGISAGGPFDILTMNGSAGDLFRRVEVSIGTASSLEMGQPPYLAAPLPFSIFGILGEAGFDSVINVPLGIGDMMFAPCPMIPFVSPSFFTLASTFGPLGLCAPLFSATPTPWTSGLGPAIPFPLLITIQGVIEESPGVYVPTNALIFEVK